jgi:F-type H+-transporting ATPase subunit delta
MSDNSARANRYAQAVLQAMLERWQSSLEQAGKAINADDELGKLLLDKQVSAAKKRKALAAALPGDTPDEIYNLLLLMGQEGDLDLIGDVSASLAETVSGQRAPLKAEIVSAVELSEQDQARLRSKLIAEYGEGLVFSFRVDPSLLGGLRVRVGDHLIDNSVASRLATLRESLSSVVR